jgi:hypothetical protein
VEEGEPSQWYKEGEPSQWYEEEVEKRVRKIRRKMERKIERREDLLVEKFGKKLQQAIIIYETEHDEIYASMCVNKKKLGKKVRSGYSH